MKRGLMQLKTWEEIKEEWYETHLDDSECEPEDYTEILFEGNTYYIHNDELSQYETEWDFMKEFKLEVLKLKLKN